MSVVTEVPEVLETPVEPIEQTPPTEVAPPVITPDPEQEKINTLIQKRLAREQRKHEREVDELRRQRDEALAVRQAPATPQPSAGAPRIDDFPTYEDYRQAATRWEIKEELRQERERENQTNAQREATRKASDWKARESKAMDSIPDYEEVADLNRLQREGALNQAMAQAVLESDHGPQLLYALSKDIDTARRLANLPPAKALLELGRMEAQYYITPSRQTTNAPPPIAPISGAKGTGTVDPSKLSDADYVNQKRAEYQARMAQRLPAAQRGRR